MLLVNSIRGIREYVNPCDVSHILAQNNELLHTRTQVHVHFIEITLVAAAGVITLTQLTFRKAFAVLNKTIRINIAFVLYFVLFESFRFVQTKTTTTTV